MSQKIQAVQADANSPGDSTLPDPSPAAKWATLGIVIAAALAALVLNWLGLMRTGGDAVASSKDETANFALFAGFYVVAQVIAAVLGLVSPWLPPWTPKVTDADSKTALAAQIKADRGALMLALAAFIGVFLSAAFGFYFLKAVGIDTSHPIDAFFTAAILAGGAKPLHDFVGLISNKKAPTTGTTGE